MAKTWVLDTETKGTGAHIAPLKRDREAGSDELSLVHFHPAETPNGSGAEEAAAATRATLFKVVDVFSARVLAEDAGAAAAVEALAGRRRAMDARVYVRNGQNERWRLLSLADTRSLWALAQRTPASTAGRRA